MCGGGCGECVCAERHALRANSDGSSGQAREERVTSVGRRMRRVCTVGGRTWSHRSVPKHPCLPQPFGDRRRRDKHEPRRNEHRSEDSHERERRPRHGYMVPRHRVVRAGSGLRRNDAPQTSNATQQRTVRGKVGSTVQNPKRLPTYSNPKSRRGQPGVKGGHVCVAASRPPQQLMLPAGARAPRSDPSTRTQCSPVAVVRVAVRWRCALACLAAPVAAGGIL